MSIVENQRLAMGLLLLLTFGASPLPAADMTGAYTWKPIAIGAGGWVDGIMISETDTSVRFVRDDTGQYYRWDPAVARWLPMVVQNDDGSGFGKAIIPEPSHGLSVVGNDGGSFALDPNGNNTLYLYLSFGDKNRYGSLPWNVYKSIDGGKNFTATRFNDTAGFTMKANDTFADSFRQDGDCLAVDPNNSQVVYIGTGTKGLFKSTDGGDTWSAMSGGGLPPPAGKNDINILPYRKGGTTVVGGVTVSKLVYLVYAKGTKADNAIAQANVYLSDDGGQTWTNITKDGGPAEKCSAGVLDPNNGVLYVKAQDPNRRRSLWKYDRGTWTHFNVDVATMTVDPNNSNNLVVEGASQYLSSDGGKTWKEFKRGKSLCSGTQTQGFSGTQHPTTSMNGKVLMDTKGTVWLVNGNDGVQTWKFDPNATDMVWTPNTKGVENFCSMDIVFPKNWGGKVLVSVMDENAMVINDLDAFDVTPIEPQGNLCNGQVISVCPNNPNTFLIAGGTPSITTDGGKTSTLLWSLGTVPKGLIFGCLQISRRGDWSAGSDHLVWLNGKKSCYSRDGGKTWAPTTTDFGKASINISPWMVSRNLVADPFTPDKFYVYFTSHGGFWTTTNGGATWTKGAAPAGDPSGYILTANYAVPNDLWLSAQGGIYHSTDAGATWKVVLGNDNLSLDHCSMALGKGSGQPGDAPYTVYYLYGTFQWDKPAKDYGVYRSTNAGASWDRISHWPAGHLAFGVDYNIGHQMAASWDTYGLVGLGCGGQGFVYGKLKVPPAPTTRQ